MPRKGKDFELLIKMLEEVILPQGASIKSPDYIVDKITGQKREVDISIKMDLGTSPILIIIECRDRKDIEDTTWIEQLRTKTNDLNANKVIAVSSFGFSAPAIDKGKHYGIETRTYKELSHDDIKSWFLPNHIVKHNKIFQIIIAKIIFSDIKSLDHDIIDKRTVFDDFIITPNDRRMVNLNGIFSFIADHEKLWDKIPIDKDFQIYNFNAYYTNPKSRFEIEHKSVVHTIAQIKFSVKMKIETQIVPISKISSYENSEAPITQIIEFDGILPGKNYSFQVIKNKDGSIQLWVMHKNKSG